jgi:acyl-CoA thioester hydrolase
MGMLVIHTYQNRCKGNTWGKNRFNRRWIAARCVLVFRFNPGQRGSGDRICNRAQVMKERAPVFFFAPFVSSAMEVAPAWIDYNGHMNVAYFHVFFDRALEEALGLLGLGEDYLAERQGSFFITETHTLYKRELRAHDPVRVTLQLLGVDEKRLHVYMELRHAREGWISATTESLGLHMDMNVRKVAPFPDDIQANIAVMKASHTRLSKPPTLGKVMGIPTNGSDHTLREPIAAAGTRH